MKKQSRPEARVKRRVGREREETNDWKEGAAVALEGRALGVWAGAKLD